MPTPILRDFRYDGYTDAMLVRHACPEVTGGTGVTTPPIFLGPLDHTACAIWTLDPASTNVSTAPIAVNTEASKWGPTAGFTISPFRT